MIEFVQNVTKITDYEEYEDSMIWCGGIKICAVINVDHIAVDLVTQDLT